MSAGGAAGAPLPSSSGRPETESEKFARWEAMELRSRSRAVLLDLLAHTVADRALLFPAAVGMMNKEDILLFEQSLIDPRKFPATHRSIGDARLALAATDHVTGIPTPTGVPMLSVAAAAAAGLSLSLLAGALLASAPLSGLVKVIVVALPTVASVSAAAVGHALARRP